MKLEEKFQSLLREGRFAPPLPLGFQKNVWHRVEKAQAVQQSTSWLDGLAALIMRPKLAFATAVGLLLAGFFLGALEGSQTARHDAQSRYVASVAPGSLR